MREAKSVLLAANDVGGAQAVSLWARENSVEFFVIGTGPAIDVFHKNLGVCNDLNISEAIDRVDFVLTGTGWQTDFEKSVIALAKEKKRYVVSFLDNWDHFEYRFLVNGVNVFPDEIWVADEYAYAIARNAFPDQKITLKYDPYLGSFDFELLKKKSKRAKSRNHALTILFLTENLQSYALARFKDKKYFGYDELDAIQYLLENTSKLGIDNFKLAIRLHPTEAPEKYESLVIQNENIFWANPKRDLIDELIECDLVAGCQTMALIVALEMGKRVISCVPSFGVPCVLPHEGIYHLNDLQNHPHSTVRKFWND